MLWSWYLSDDTQFYVLGAILLILATSHFKIATFSLSVFLLSSWITTGYVSIINNHSPSTDDPLALFDKIYDKPWTRLGPYLIGMSVGWLLFKTNCRIKMSLLANMVGWLASAACLLSLVYGLYEVDLSVTAGAAYSSLSHSAWALALGWIVVACATGNGGFVNSLLSATILYPISRITYCAYLLHPLVMRIMVMHMDYPLHLGKPLMITVFIGQVVMSYALGFVVSVVYEAPIVSMLKIFTKIPISRPKRVTTTTT
ncbi:Acyltransferase [Oryctes borbonicus]|uniref:Acyltransferase n=1 Tax=Oryctes borbonicus TaxID=1629725 RepID=A0A0T6AZR9_9SCAR|nr:Acyltransferase [Oryctes borbonicus]